MTSLSLIKLEGLGFMWCFGVGVDTTCLGVGTPKGGLLESYCIL